MEDAVPRLPRGRGLRLSGPLLVRIAVTVFVLVSLVMMQRSCSNAVSTFVTGFGSAGDRGSAAAAMPHPGKVNVPAGAAGTPGSAGATGSAGAMGQAGATGAGSAAASDASTLEQYEHLHPGMTDDEIKAVIERARHKAAGSSAVP